MVTRGGAAEWGGGEEGSGGILEGGGGIPAPRFNDLRLFPYYKECSPLTKSLTWWLILFSVLIWHSYHPASRRSTDLERRTGLFDCES